MATYEVNPGVNSSVTLSGSVVADAQFATQPVVGDQIVFPNNLTVDAQLNINGPEGTHTLWHVKLNGQTVATSYVISGGGIAIGSFPYAVLANYTQATLQAGFDPYVFEGWTTPPEVGGQLVTESQYGWFDNLGNYYSNVENIHDAWYIDLNGVATHFTIDNRLDVTSSDITPNPYSIAPLLDQPRNSTVTFSAFDVLGMDAGLDSPITVTNGTWSKSSDNGSTWSPHTSALGFVRNNDKVEIQHITASDGLVDTDTGVDINGVTATATSTTAADLTPDVFNLGTKTNVALSSLVESDPVQIAGMTPGQDSPINVTNGEYAISTNGGTSYGPFTSASGAIQNGNFVKVRQLSSAAEADPTVSTLDINGVTANFVSTTLSTVGVIVGVPGVATFPDARTKYFGPNLPSSPGPWLPMDIKDRLDYGWDIGDWLEGDTIASVQVTLGEMIVDSAIYSDTKVQVWINPDKPGSTAKFNDDAIKVTVIATTVVGREIELSADFTFVDR